MIFYNGQILHLNKVHLKINFTDIHPDI